MKEIANLVAKARKFLKTVEAAIALGDSDSCASRCYYAMFFMAEASFKEELEELLVREPE